MINSTFFQANKNRVFSSTWLLVLAMLLPFVALPQDKNKQTKEFDKWHNEVLEGEYIPVSAEGRQTSPAYHRSSSAFFTTQVNIDENGDNIIGDAANEPSIAIDPTDPDKMVIGWRQFNTISNSFRQAGYAYTTDGGETWTFPGVIDEGVFRSDPVLASDADGNIFYNSLTVSGSNYYCDVYKMDAGETEWDDGTYALGGDKQWMIIDNTNGVGADNIYAFWTSAYSICYPRSFTRSLDNGDTYEYCDFVEDDPRWGTLAVADNGDLFIGGSNSYGFMVTKTSTAKNENLDVLWDFAVSVDLDGFPAMGGPNPAGLLGQAWVAIDNSNDRNNVYLLSSVDRYTDLLDVMFNKSTDGGVNWGEPVRINTDISNGNWQWFGTMSVAPNGRIDVVWLDTRDFPGSYISSLYYCYSADGGETWSENEQLSESFNPHLGWPQQDKMGDYFHMVSDDDYAHLAWANTLNGEQDVYYGRINPWYVGVEEEDHNEELSLFAYPNPAKETANIRYQLNNSSVVKLAIFDLMGQEIELLVNENQQAGRYDYKLDTSDLTDGIYYCKLKTPSSTKTIKLIVVKK